MTVPFDPEIENLPLDRDVSEHGVCVDRSDTRPDVANVPGHELQPRHPGSWRGGSVVDLLARIAPSTSMSSGNHSWTAFQITSLSIFP